ncbi:sugar phosphate nucleotidyltransferase [Pseudonocardia sp. CA-107938]|uniref:sugar phosphate nucleotidyltransferase n=1 Tax=Pseudonocardia sp. CA-107938 TaxID=3240021 RepID=UPI003D8E491C
MKVVLFCGGYGMRMRDGQTDLPKPMMTVGPRPLLWHVMRYYAHYGHTDFVLCLGYGAQHIKDYFLTYAETASNDFVLSGGQVELLGSDIQDWRITFVHTGQDSPIGERLRRVREHVQDEEMFLANYADVLTDLPLDTMIEEFAASNAVGSLVAVPPQAAFHCIEVADDGQLNAIHSLTDLPLWENGGYFVLRPEIFDHLPENGDLIADACTPLAKAGRMLAFRHKGFWHAADTIKERAALEALYRSGRSPWMVWQPGDDREPLQPAMAGLTVNTEHER